MLQIIAWHVQSKVFVESSFLADVSLVAKRCFKVKFWMFCQNIRKFEQGLKTKCCYGALRTFYCHPFNQNNFYRHSFSFAYFRRLTTWPDTEKFLNYVSIFWGSWIFRQFHGLHSMQHTNSWSSIKSCNDVLLVRGSIAKPSLFSMKLGKLQSSFYNMAGAKCNAATTLLSCAELGQHSL